MGFLNANQMTPPNYSSMLVNGRIEWSSFFAYEFDYLRELRRIWGNRHQSSRGYRIQKSKADYWTSSPDSTRFVCHRETIRSCTSRYALLHTREENGYRIPPSNCCPERQTVIREANQSLPVDVSAWVIARLTQVAVRMRQLGVMADWDQGCAFNSRASATITSNSWEHRTMATTRNTIPRVATPNRFRLVTYVMRLASLPTSCTVKIL